MFLVCLTGGIACGKTTVSQILEQEGCAVIDADIIAREVVAINTNGWRLVRQHFGSEICGEDGNIDRAKLGQIVFADSAQRKLLNSITHPLIRRRMIWLIIQNLFRGLENLSKCSDGIPVDAAFQRFFDLLGHRYLIAVSPLLTESKSFMSSLFSEIAVVYCEESEQLRRLQKRNALTEEEAQQRISSQMPIEMKKKHATGEICLVNNGGTVDQTRVQVLALKRYLDSSWRPEIFRLLLLLTTVSIIGAVRYIFS